MVTSHPARNKRVVVAVVGILIASAVAFWWFRSAKIDARDQAFERATREDTKESILRSLGQPDRVAPCGSELSWNGAESFKNDGRCVESWSYKGGVLIRYEVSFDTNGRVIAKYRFVSE